MSEINQNRDVGLSGIAILPNRMRALRPEVVAALAQSMKQQGLLNPISLRESDATGYYLVAGRHRLEAARQLGWDSISARVLPAKDADEAMLAEIDENLIRAELTPAETAAHQSTRKEVYLRLHPETRKGAGGRSGRENKSEVRTYIEDAADKTGRSRSTIAQEAKRGGEVPNVARLARTSLDKGAELDALAKLPADKRDALIDRAIAGEKVSAKTELKKEQRDSRERVLAVVQLAMPEKKYGLIYCDIPRHFNVHSDETGLDRAPENHYPTMSFDECCRLPVADIAADDCILVFWSTAASLMDDLDIMAEWGFVTFRPRTTKGKLVRAADGSLAEPIESGGRYCSMQVWDKVKMGLGYWFRDRHEFILVAARGNVVAPAPGTQDQSLFSEVKGRHSAKPAHVAEMIERLWPNTPKIELFARTARDGWDVYGKEAPCPTAPMTEPLEAQTQCQLGSESPSEGESTVDVHDLDASSVDPASLPPCDGDAGQASVNDDLEIPVYLDRRHELRAAE